MQLYTFFVNWKQKKIETSDPMKLASEFRLQFATLTHTSLKRQIHNGWLTYKKNIVEISNIKYKFIID